MIDVVFDHDRRTVHVVSSKGISHYETTSCDGTVNKVELPAGSDERELTVGPFDQPLLSIRVKAGSDHAGSTFASGATCPGGDPAEPEPETTTNPIVSPTDPVGPGTTETTTVLPPPPPAPSPSCPSGASPGTVEAVGAFAIRLRSCQGNQVLIYSDPNVSVSFPDLSLQFGVGYGPRTVVLGDGVEVTWTTDAYHRVRSVEVVAGGRASKVVPAAYPLGSGEAYTAATELSDAQLRELAIELAACEGPVFAPIACIDPQLLREEQPGRIDRISASTDGFATAPSSVRIEGDTGSMLRTSSLVAFATLEGNACGATPGAQALVPQTVRMTIGWWDWWSWWAPQASVRGAFSTGSTFVPGAAGRYRICAYLTSLGATTAVASGDVTILAPRFEAEVATTGSLVEGSTATIDLRGVSDLARGMTAFIGSDTVPCAATSAAHHATAGVETLTPVHGNDALSVAVRGAWAWSVEHRLRRSGPVRVCAYLHRATSARPDRVADVVLSIADRPRGNARS